MELNIVRLQCEECGQVHSYSKYCAQKEQALICGKKKEKVDLVYGGEKSDAQAGIEEFAGTVWLKTLNCHSSFLRQGSCCSIGILYYGPNVRFKDMA